MSVSVQEDDFDVGAEMAAMSAGRQDIGALVSFTGLVREMAGGPELVLEHYPGMTEKALGDIEREARARWDLQDCRIIHRYGPLAAGARIVLVLTASPHRQAAFEAAEFIMDFLKSRAPFWKKEAGGSWVDARESDEAALDRWK
ncbi:MAG: molybdenum cofactor biosynthesis protein MoaE [Rhodobacteraceae bacterium]|nr:molybdenum cofactor biosynthesis protein MoaE [Paracoccaceae bacterium]